MSCARATEAKRATAAAMTFILTVVIGIVVVKEAEWTELNRNKFVCYVFCLRDTLGNSAEGFQCRGRGRGRGKKEILRGMILRV